MRTAQEFKEEDKLLREKRMTKVKDSESGEQAETVYRDKRGRKLDMLNEFMRQQVWTFSLDVASLSCGTVGNP